MLLLFNFFLYANCLFNGFVFDDHSQIELNPYVHSIRYVGKLFGTSLLAQQGKQAVPNFYRPLTNFTFLVGHELFGESPLGYHLISILIHCTAVWLVFLVGSKLFRSDLIGLLAAFLFSVHPAHVEPIAWIDGIGDQLVTVFVLFAFWFYLHSNQPGDSSPKIQSVGMVFTFAAALLTKETAVVFPALVVIFEHFYREDRDETRWTQKFARYGSLWLTLLAYVGLRVSAVGQLIPSQLHSEVTPGEAVLSAIALIGQYARKLIWPAPLVAFYPFQKSTSLFQPAVLLGLCAIAGAFALFLILWRRAHLHSFTLIWIALAIAPALNTRWMTASVFAERYLYLPTVAYSWLVAGGLLWMWNRAGEKARILRWVTAAAVGVLSGLATYASFARTYDWRSDRSVVFSTLRVLPDSPHTHVQYGMFRWAEGDHAEAEHEWQLALSLNPESVEAMAQLGRARLAEKKYDQAQAWLQKAMVLKPNFATPHVLLGEVFSAQGNSNAAEAEFQRAIASNPTDAEAMTALGTLYLQSRRLEDAAREFRAAAEIASVMSTWVSLGEIYDQLNQPDNAADAWSHVVALERFNPEAHRSLGQIYLSRRQWNAAQNEFQMCLLMNPKDAVALAGMQKIKAGSTKDSKTPQ